MKKRIIPVISILTGTALLVLISSFQSPGNGAAKIGKYDSTDSGICPASSIEKQSSGMNGYTGSSPDGGSTCNGCHSGGSATPTVTLTATPAFVNNTYVPGQSYTIAYSVAGYSYFGFNLEMNDGNTSGSTTAGTLTAVSTNNCKVYTSTPKCVSHKTMIASSSSATFTWVAPTNATNSVYLFSIGLGVNGTGGTGGDKQVAKNLVLTAAAQSGAGLSELSDANKFLASYSASQNSILYTLNTDSEGSASFNLVDMNGRTVYSNQIGAINEKQSHTEFLPENIGNGVYIVKFQVGSKMYTKKVMIQK